MKSNKNQSLSIQRIYLFFLFIISPAIFSAPNTSKIPKFSPDEVLVAFQPGTPAADISNAHQKAGARVTRTILRIGVQVVKVAEGTVLDKIKLYRRNPNIKYAELNYYRPLIIPNEGNLSVTLDAFDEQWNLLNSGQILQTYQNPNTLAPWGPTVSGADIEATTAWDTLGSFGNSTIKIAFPDSGVDCSHPDLSGKCVHILDNVTPTVNSDGIPIPDFIDQIGHGTHVAGIAAAFPNNTTGIAGIADVDIGSFKVCYLETFLGFFIGSTCEDADIADAVIAAADFGYNVISMSFGGGHSAVVQAAIDYAYSQGVVLIAASGNNYNWNEVYPAAYSNVVSFGAYDAFGNLAGFSTFSLDSNDWVDNLAPGHPIISLGSSDSLLYTCPAADCLTWNSGTSMAAPHGTGVAGLVWSQLLADNPNLLNTLASKISARDEIIGRFRNVNCTDTSGPLGQSYLSYSKYGGLNARKMLECANPSPSPPADPYVYVFDTEVNNQNLSQGNKQGIATVTIYDQNNNPVSGILVTGAFSGKTSDAGLAMSTDVNGTATFYSSFARGGGEWCFEVTGTNNDTYDETLNNVTKSCESGDVF